MSDSTNDASSSSGTAPPPPQGNRRALNFDALINHAAANKIDCTLWAIRLLSIFFTLGYLVPIFGSAQNSYHKVLIANAAISALRLHQRIGRVRLSREFIAELLMEDSFHYLFYSLIFLYVAPVTLVLLPIVLFSLLHFASYSLTLLDCLGQNSWWGARLLISLVEFQSLNILRLVAFTEIVLMPTTVLLILFGKASLITPFIYYHFLTQRYTSRRNPYTKNMFRELRMFLEMTANKPRTPEILKKAMLFAVSFTCRLAPPHLQAQQQQQQQ